MRITSDDPRLNGIGPRAYQRDQENAEVEMDIDPKPDGLRHVEGSFERRR